MKFPAPETTVKIPEGHYSFRLNREPELRKFTFTNKQGAQREAIKVVLFAIGLNETGEYRIVDALLPWEDRYAEFLLALGIEHSKDVTVDGAFFEADVRHEMDKKDPTKSWPRLHNFTKQGDVPQDAENGGDDIPF